MAHFFDKSKCKNPFGLHVWSGLVKHSKSAYTTKGVSSCL